MFSYIYVHTLADICEETISENHLINGNVYIRGKDKDGKIMMWFRVRIYGRNGRTINELKIFLIYWVINLILFS